MPRNPWTCEQDLAVLFVKIKHKEQLKQSHPAIAMLAKAMKRTVAAIWMRKGNFDFLDPCVLGKGLENVAKQTACVWDKYLRDPEGTLDAARRAYLNLKRQAESCCQCSHCR